MKADEKYPYVIEAIRQNLGLAWDDTSRDDEILSMSKDVLFKRFLTWNGIIGYDGKIKAAIMEIYEVSLE